MLEFFRGWKRKVGCVTLVIACVFAAGWVRSISTRDIVVAPLIHQFKYSLFSNRCTLTFSYVEGDEFDESEWIAEPVFDGLPDGMEDPERKTHRWRFWGFDHTFTPIAFHGSMPFKTSYTIPYWSIVLPLTALSAWLLLSKPRSKTEPPIAPASENT